MLRKINHRNVVRLLAFDENKMILERLVCDMQAVLFRKPVAKSAGFTHGWIRRNRLQVTPLRRRCRGIPVLGGMLHERASCRWLSNSREACARCMATASCTATSSRRTSYWTVKASPAPRALSCERRGYRNAPPHDLRMHAVVRAAHTRRHGPAAALTPIF
jgi:hypothetical protein